MAVLGRGTCTLRGAEFQVPSSVGHERPAGSFLPVCASGARPPLSGFGRGPAAGVLFLIPAARVADLAPWLAPRGPVTLDDRFV